eukprot:g1844.t1
MWSRGSSRGNSRPEQHITTPKESRICVAAVSISRNHGTVGVACMDLSDQSQVSISQVAVNHFYSNAFSLIQSQGATTILIPDTQLTSRFGEALQESFGKYASIVSINRRYFNESDGLELVQTHAANTLETDIHRKYLALSAFATLIRWTEHEKHVMFSAKALHVRWRELSGSLMIDRASVRHLEIVRNARTGSERKGSLFAALNFTKTAVGKRMLRTRLLCPPNRENVVKMRLDSLEEMLHNEEMFYRTQQSLSEFVNLDSMVSHLATAPKDASIRAARQSIRHLIALKHTLEIAPKFAKALSGATSNVLMRAREAASSTLLRPMRAAINRVLTQDTNWSSSTVTMIQQTIFAVRSGTDAELDIARMTYSDMIEALTNYVDALQKELNTDLRLNYTVRRGYIFETPRESESKVPVGTHAVRAVRQGKKIRWSTERLLAINNRIDECVKAVFERIHPVLTGLRAELRTSIGILFELLNAIGSVDVCMSFAEMITTQEPGSFVRPKIDASPNGTLAIKEGRHPIVEQCCRQTDARYSPTNVFVGPVTKNVIITGSNGSGKSTLMKKIAIFSIMAHASCYVPAKFAQVRLCDRIFTRIGVEDDMEANSSTFMTEMKEVAFILENSSQRSLILIDELGRGTSHRGGLSLAWSICERIALTRPHAHVFCATHYLELTQLASMYPMLFKNVSLSCDIDVEGGESTESKRKHRVHNCPMSKREGYGISTARACGFPSRTIQRAEEISRKVKPLLTQGLSVSLNAAAESGISASAQTRILQRLMLLKQSTSGLRGIRAYLERLRKKFVAPAMKRKKKTQRK